VTEPRALWRRFELVHAVVYFAPEHRAAMDALGTKGGWMAYFASRSAPLGAASAELVSATFFNFAPAMVARALPDAWALVSPDDVLAARYRGVAGALRGIFGPTAQVIDVLPAIRAAAEAPSVSGRPLYAANRALAWPGDPIAALWHATTLLREHRGDGHVAALLAAGIDGCAAHVLAAAAAGLDGEVLRSRRGWTTEEWAQAGEGLRGRGLLDADGRLTEAGRSLRDDIEQRTDELAAEPWRHLGEQRTRQVYERLGPLAAAVHRSGVVPFPNPMGLTAEGVG
jgi:hypothetical protein